MRSCASSSSILYWVTVAIAASVAATAAVICAWRAVSLFGSILRNVANIIWRKYVHRYAPYICTGTHLTKMMKPWSCPTKA